MRYIVTNLMGKYNRLNEEFSTTLYSMRYEKLIILQYIGSAIIFRKLSELILS